MDPLAFLADSALFRDVPRQDLEALGPAVKTRTFRTGNYIFREGDVGAALFVIRSGQVKISRMGPGGDEAVYAVLMPGDSFGEIALLSSDGLRTADAQAMELTECIVVARAAFTAFLNQNPAMMGRLMGILAGYVQQVDTNIAEIAFLDIAGRVARKLLDLSQTHGERTSDGIRIKIRLSQRTLASMVAASRENVNRALQRFVAAGAIKQDGGTITIVRPAELRKRS